MDDRISTDKWRLAQLRPNCLQLAQRNLLRQGFKAFCPVEEQTRRRGGKFVSVVAPLFPGYLFVSAPDGAAPLRAINSTYGVSRLVAFCEHAAAEVPAQIVSGLIGRCDETGLLKPPAALQPGDAVKVMSGPFADFVGAVETLGQQERVWVLLDLMGGATRVVLKNRSIQKV